MLCVRDTNREDDVRPLRMRNGRLLVRLVADPPAADIVEQTRRASLPLSETVIIGAAESQQNEEIREVKGADSILELEIVDSLDGVTGFTNHHERHEDGGDDEVEVTGLSGKLADPQPTDLKAEGYEPLFYWLALEGA